MDTKIYEKLKDLSEKYLEEVIMIRRDIHKHPELGFKEFRTAELVAKELKTLGLEVETGVGKTGVVGILDSKKPGKTLAIRAELDALPIEEETDLEFKSINRGVMHACGHDVHTANLIGVAKILTELKSEITGKIKFIFQPSEEVNAGAREMVKEGVLENPKVDAILGMHVVPEEVGNISYGYSEQTSFTDYFSLDIRGKQSHTAKPHEGIDAILISGHIITALQAISSSFLKPTDTATFSLGRISGGTEVNIIPDNVKIDGMLRATNKESRDVIRQQLETISKNTARALGGDCDLILEEGYPAIYNDREFTSFFAKSAADYVDYEKVHRGKEYNLYEVYDPILAGEDFGFFSDLVPACYISIGAGDFAPQHNPKFMVDEDMFKISLNLMSAVAIDYLK